MTRRVKYSALPLDFDLFSGITLAARGASRDVGLSGCAVSSVVYVCGINERRASA